MTPAEMYEQLTQENEDKLFLSALQNETYRKEILEILYQQEETR